MLTSVHIMMCTVFCCCASTAAAQQDTLIASSQELDSVEVVASALQPVRSPVVSQHLGSERLMNTGTMDMAQALTHLAGITVRDYGGAGGMKTVSVHGAGARHTVVSYDGLALGDCQTGEIDLSRYTLDQLEGLSLDMGDGADIFQPARNMSGLALLRLHPYGDQPSDSRPHVRMQMAIGAWKLLSPSLNYRQRISEKVDVAAMGAFTHAKNNYPFRLYNINTYTRERRVNSQMNDGNVAARLRWRPTARDTLSVSMAYTHNGRQLPGLVRLYTSEADEQLREQSTMLQARWHRWLSRKWQLSVSGRYQYLSTDYHNGIPNGTISEAHYRQQEAYATAGLCYRPQRWLSLSYAADYIWNGLEGAMTGYRHPQRHTVLQQVAAKADWRRLLVTARMLATWSHEVRGASFDGMETADDKARVSRLSPSFALSYRLLAESPLYVRASWKNIFRIPTFTERYQYHLGSEHLKPERVGQWSAGLMWHYNNASDNNSRSAFSLTASADFFASRVTDKIVAIPYNMFVWRMVNLAQVDGRGIDATLQVTWSPAPQHTIGLSVNYSWQRIMNHTNVSSPYYGYQIAYTPQHTYCASLYWKNPWLSAAITNHVLGERWASNEHMPSSHMDAFNETAVSLWRTFRWQRMALTLRCSVVNIFNKQYEIVARYPMPGRSWRAAVVMEM